MVPRPVPVELHLHPAVLVGKDLLAIGPGADHDGGLRSLNQRLGRLPQGSIRQGQRRRGEVVVIAKAAYLAGAISAQVGDVDDTGEQITAIVALDAILLKDFGEAMAAEELPAVADPANQE